MKKAKQIRHTWRDSRCAGGQPSAKDEVEVAQPREEAQGGEGEDRTAARRSGRTRQAAPEGGGGAKQGEGAGDALEPAGTPSRRRAVVQAVATK